MKVFRMLLSINILFFIWAILLASFTTQLQGSSLAGTKYFRYQAGDLVHLNRIYTSESGIFSLIANGSEVESEPQGSGMLMLYRNSDCELADVITNDNIDTVGFFPQCPIISRDDRYILINGYQGEWGKHKASYIIKYDIINKEFTDIVKLDNVKIPIRTSISDTDYFCIYGNGEILSMNIETMQINWVVNVTEKYKGGPLDVCYFNNKLLCLVYDQSTNGRLIALTESGEYDETINYSMRDITGNIVYGAYGRLFESGDKIIFVGYNANNSCYSLNVLDSNLKNRQTLDFNSSYQCNINKKYNTFTAMNNAKICTYDLNDISSPKYEQPLLSYSSPILATGNYIGNSRVISIADQFLLLSDYSDSKTKLLTLPGNVNNIKRYNKSDDMCISTRCYDYSYNTSYVCKYDPSTSIIEDFYYCDNMNEGKFDISIDDQYVAMLVRDEELSIYNTIRILNASDMSLKQTIQYDEDISSIHFYKNSENIILTTYSGDIIIYDISLDKVVQQYSTNTVISDLLLIDNYELILVTAKKDIDKEYDDNNLFSFAKYSLIDEKVIPFKGGVFFQTNEIYNQFASYDIPDNDSLLYILSYDYDICIKLHINEDSFSSLFYNQLGSSDNESASIISVPQSSNMIVCNFDTENMLILDVDNEQIIQNIDLSKAIPKLKHSYIYPILSKDKKSVYLFSANTVPNGDNNSFRRIENISILDIGNVLSVIEEMEGSVESEFQLFPNPAVNYVHIRNMSDYRGNATVLLYDITGNLVLHQDMWFSDAATIVLPYNLSMGEYILEIKMNNKKISKIININRR